MPKTTTVTLTAAELSWLQTVVLTRLQLQRAGWREALSRSFSEAEKKVAAEMGAEIPFYEALWEKIQGKG